MGIQHHRQLSNLASAWWTQPFIADKFLPKKDVVDTSFERTEWDRFWDEVDTRVGKTSAPLEIEIGSNLIQENLQAHSLIGRYAMFDVMREMHKPMDQQSNIRANSMYTVLHSLELAREKEASDLLTDRDSYNSDMRMTLSGSAQWSHDDSNPIRAIAQAAETFIGPPPNKLLIGSEVYARLRSHPKVLEAYNGKMKMNAGQQGMLGTAELAMVFGVEEVVVGTSRYNRANKGADEDLARVWGKIAVLAHVSTMLSLQMPMPVFGITACINDIKVQTEEGGVLNLEGSEGVGKVKVTQYRKPFIVSKECGFLFDAVIA